MSAKSWINLEPSLRPYPSAGVIDISDVLIRNEYDAKMLFEKADEFLKSQRFADSSGSYGEDAILEKPDGTEVICEPSAWDFCDGETYRVGLKLGSTLPWRQVLTAISRETDISTTGIKTYFKPLYEYLLTANETISPSQLKEFLSGEYAERAQEVYSKQVHAE
ncbi:Angiotensin-converting enzyme [Popillia japonica]|uniref:Angiotensin-converting enzyme n=1 Tax=Popillia japonica TaxID=7064 RepID=A0AAW1KJD7_POPJA